MRRVSLTLTLLLAACAPRAPEPEPPREPGVPLPDSGIRSLDEAMGRYKCGKRPIVIARIGPS